MKKIVLLFILISGYAFSQSVNDYQYVIVPAKFTIFKEKDKFRLNSNVKLLLQKYGFKAFLSTDTIPNEIAGSNCKMLHTDLQKDNNFFMTKVKIILKDCNDRVIYETAFGSSKEKDLLIAYNQALREAGKSFDKLNYKYNGKNEVVSNSVSAENSISKKLVGITGSMDIIKANSSSIETFYFAQPIANGYQLIDTEPKVIMKMFNTSQKDVFIAGKINLSLGG